MPPYSFNYSSSVCSPMFPSGFPKPPCSRNVGSAPLCCCLCNSLLEANKHGGIEQELLGHQPWRRSKKCRMHVDRSNRMEIMINRISCRFKWDGNWEWRQSSFLAAGVLLLMSQPPLRNDVFHVDFLPGPERGWHSLGMVPLFSLLAFPLGQTSQEYRVIWL